MCIKPFRDVCTRRFFGEWTFCIDVVRVFEALFWLLCTRVLAWFVYIFVLIIEISCPFGGCDINRFNGWVTFNAMVTCLFWMIMLINYVIVLNSVYILKFIPICLLKHSFILWEGRRKFSDILFLLNFYSRNNWKIEKTQLYLLYQCIYLITYCEFAKPSADRGTRPKLCCIVQ